MKRNIHSGTVYTNQGGTAQIGSYSRASRPVVERAIKNLAALGTGKAQPSRICAQNASTGVEHSPNNERCTFGSFEIVGVTGHRIGRFQAPKDDQASETEGLSVGLRRNRFAVLTTSQILVACSHPQLASGTEMVTATRRRTSSRPLEVNGIEPEATLTMSVVPMNAGATEAQMIGVLITDASSSICGRGIIPTQDEDINLLRLCEGIGYIASTMVLEP